jgi:transposase InsO family protein
MDLHENARSCPASRERMVSRIEEGRPVGEAADAAGLSVRSGYRWLKRWREEGRAGLRDRSSRPRKMPRRLSEEQIQQIRLLRETDRISGAEIADRLRVPRSTVARWLSRLGLGRLPQLAPPEPVRRYQKEVAGELVHLDIKKLGKIHAVGHRIHGDRRIRKRGTGWEFTHVAIDDASRLSYVETLSDERGVTAAAFLERAVAWFVRSGITVQKILTDNGPCYLSKTFAQLCARLGIKHKRTRPYRPRTNGKAERFIQTLLREWAYAFAFTSSAARDQVLNRYLHFYNHHRAHTGIGRLSPVAWLIATNVVRINS